MTAYRNIEELIGNTPMLDVSALSPNPEVEIWAKLEGHNPTGSVKDRIALAMVNKAENEGRLKPGSIILEPSSGNTGISLALIARRRGYQLKVVLPENVSPERQQMLQAFGVETITSPGEQGSNGAVRMAQELAAEHDDWVMLFQYGNADNPQAHYDTTGPEILTDVPQITHFVACLGTSGTLLGAGRYLREHKSKVEIWAIEPPAGERVEGLRNLSEGFVPPVFDEWNGLELLDRKMIVRQRESIEGTRELLNKTGVFAGISSGAALAGARKAAEQIESGAVVFVASDHGWKYLSTNAWDDDLDTAVQRLGDVIYF